MYILAVMEDWELERLKQSGNKERYLAVYFSAPNMPEKVTRLYIAFPGDQATQGYFEVHEQYGNTVAMWGEDFVAEETPVTDFTHIVGLEPLLSKFIKRVKGAKEAKREKKRKKTEENETSEPRLRPRKAWKGRNST